MNEDEIDDLYRRTSALDPSRPGESTRRSILDYAARVAAERSAPTPLDAARRAPRRVWRSALVGTLAAALLAGLVVVPRLWAPPVPPHRELDKTAAVPTIPAPAPAPAPAPEPAPLPRLAEIRPAPLATLKSAPVDSLAAESAPRADAAQSAESQTMAQSSRQARAASSFAAPQSTLRLRAVDSAAALRRAAQVGDLAALDQALAQPLDVNARDDQGRTALMVAILNGQEGAVDALLAHGADPNAADAAGITPLAAASSRADPGIAVALRRAGARAAQ